MAPPPTPRRVVVQPLQELRIELEADEGVSVRLLNGTAEIFGHELASGLEWPLTNECRAAVFTWTGCEIEMSTCATEYIAEETPVPSHYNAHLALEHGRIKCRPPASFLAPDDPVHRLPQHEQEDESYGPRVLIIGESGSGKSTLSKSLINWALRSGRARRDGDWTDAEAGRKVLFVNLDPSDGAFTIPGTLSAAAITSILPTTTPVHPFGSTHSTSLPPLSQPSATEPLWQPACNVYTLSPMHSGLSFFCGSTSWGKNEGLTDALLKRLGDCVRRRVDESGDEGIWRGGLIVDTPAEFAKKDKAAVVQRCVREFEINVILVVGNERLHLEMVKLVSTNKSVSVIRVPKNGGATPNEPAYKRRLQAAQIRSYFYGGPSVSLGSLTPHSMSIRFDILSLNRVGEESAVPLSALPIGHTRLISDTQLVEIDPEEPGSVGELLGKIVALPQIEGTWERKSARAEVEEATAAAKTEEGETAAGEVDGNDAAGEEQDGGEAGEYAYPAVDAARAAEDAEVASSPVMGFVHITSIDTNKHKYTVLSPLPGRLPRTRLIVGTLDWQEA